MAPPDWSTLQEPCVCTLQAADIQSDLLAGFVALNCLSTELHERNIGAKLIRLDEGEEEELKFNIDLPYEFFFSLNC